MRSLEILARVPDRSAEALYPILCDFARYPAYSAAVRAIEIISSDNARMVSQWEVNFQKGILKWTEEDRFDPENHAIYFEQIEGDVDVFTGAWMLRDIDQGCLVQFTSEFDLGLPSLSDILEPIAEQALRENVHSILRGLLGANIEFLVTADPASTPSGGQ